MQQIRPAHVGDHALIHQLLLATQQQPAQERFSAWLDDPGYAPADRLLLTQDNQLIGHIHITQRQIYWGKERLVSAGLHDLVALPEFDACACKGELLCAAEDRLREDGVVLAMMRTTSPQPFERFGWVRLGRDRFSRANAHEVLAHVSAQPHAARRERRFSVRVWRQVELDPLLDLYDQLALNMCGTMCRNARYWHWQIGRSEHDSLLIVETSRHATKRPQGQIVGYVVTQADRIIELFVMPGYEPAAVSLLARTCRDCVERGYHTVSLHLPDNHPLHELMLTAGGQWCPSDAASTGVTICKVFQMDHYVQRMHALLVDRAQQGKLHLPCSVGVTTDSHAWQLTVARRTTRLDRDVEIDQPCAARCSLPDMQRLLLGKLDIDEAVSSRRLQCDDTVTFGTLQTLFAPITHWQSLWDAPMW